MKAKEGKEAMMVDGVAAQRTEPLYRQAKNLPKDVLMMIFERLSEVDLAKSRRVCRQWNVVGRDERVAWKFEYAFGAGAWYRYFGQVGVEPPLPAGTYAILNEPCPFWSGKKVHETHLLVLIPTAVNGKSFTLDSLGEMIEKPRQGHATKYGYYWDKLKKEHGNKRVRKGYWVLMTRDVLPESRRKGYSEQKQLVEKQRGYEVPKLLEAATCVLMEYVKTGKRLYSDNPWISMRCQDQTFNTQGVVGGFSSGGLVIYDDLGYGPRGIGGARKL